MIYIYYLGRLVLLLFSGFFTHYFRNSIERTRVVRSDAASCVGFDTSRASTSVMPRDAVTGLRASEGMASGQFGLDVGMGGSSDVRVRERRLDVF